jgi:hypothetical protein
MDSTWKEIQLEATTPLATKHVKGFPKRELKHQQTINHNYACRILSLSHHVGGGGGGGFYVLSTKPKVDPKIKDGEEEVKQLRLNKQNKS